MSENTTTLDPETEENDIVTIQFSKKSVKRKAIMVLAAVGGLTLAGVILSRLPGDDEEENDSAETPSDES